MPIRSVETAVEVERAGEAVRVVLAGKRLADVVKRNFESTPRKRDALDLHVRAIHAADNNADLGCTVFVRGVVEEEVMRMRLYVETSTECPGVPSKLLGQFLGGGDGRYAPTSAMMHHTSPPSDAGRLAPSVTHSSSEVPGRS